MTTTPSTPEGLPNLPEPMFPHNIGTLLFTADQMQAYALAAMADIQQKLDDMTADYLRRHREVCELKYGNAALTAQQEGQKHLAACDGGGVTQPPPVECADPMDTPLPCDVTVGHGTMRKGVALRVLVARMQVLYEMACPPGPKHDISTLMVGGRCEKHLSVKPCAKCAQGLPAPSINDLRAPARGNDDATGQIKEPVPGILPVKESDHE